MPYKLETTHFKLTPETDRRRKLSLEQYDEIRNKYSLGSYSQRQLAKEYGVSRRLITFILDPAKLERSRSIRDNAKYYDKEKHREYMQACRAHKKQVYAAQKEKDVT